MAKLITLAGLASIWVTSVAAQNLVLADCGIGTVPGHPEWSTSREALWFDAGSNNPLVALIPVGDGTYPWDRDGAGFTFSNGAEWCAFIDHTAPDGQYAGYAHPSKGGPPLYCYANHHNNMGKAHDGSGDDCCSAFICNTTAPNFGNPNQGQGSFPGGLPGGQGPAGGQGGAGISTNPNGGGNGNNPGAPGYGDDQNGPGGPGGWPWGNGPTGDGSGSGTGPSSPGSGNGNGIPTAGYGDGHDGSGGFPNGGMNGGPGSGSPWGGNGSPNGGMGGDPGSGSPWGNGGSPSGGLGTEGNTPAGSYGSSGPGASGPGGTGPNSGSPGGFPQSGPFGPGSVGPDGSGSGSNFPGGAAPHGNSGSGGFPSGGSGNGNPSGSGGSGPNGAPSSGGYGGFPAGQNPWGPGGSGPNGGSGPGGNNPWGPGAATGSGGNGGFPGSGSNGNNPWGSGPGSGAGPNGMGPGDKCDLRVLIDVHPRQVDVTAQWPNIIGQVTIDDNGNCNPTPVSLADGSVITFSCQGIPLPGLTYPSSPLLLSTLNNLSNNPTWFSHHPGPNVDPSDDCVRMPMSMSIALGDAQTGQSFGSLSYQVHTNKLTGGQCAVCDPSSFDAAWTGAVASAFSPAASVFDSVVTVSKCVPAQDCLPAE